MPMLRYAVRCVFAVPISGKAVRRPDPGARTGRSRSGIRRPGAFRFEG